MSVLGVWRAGPIVLALLRELYVRVQTWRQDRKNGEDLEWW